MRMIPASSLPPGSGPPTIRPMTPDSPNADAGPLLFQPLELRGTTLRNRIVVSPMCMYSAVEGVASAWHHVHLGSLACSGVGLVIAEATSVEARGRITPNCLGLWNDDCERALARVVATVREVAPKAAFGIQLGHAGRKASHAHPWAPARGYVKPEDGGWTTVGVSENSYEDIAPHAHALDRRDLDAERLRRVREHLRRRLLL